jgi:hypothetical protein
MTATYAATRVQFDKPIGSFQAIKHPLVNVLIAVEQLRTLVAAAASALDAGDPEAERLARMAKAAASEAYPFACSRAVQIHGGYGFTEDCDAHLYLRRALASRPARRRRSSAPPSPRALLAEGGATSLPCPSQSPYTLRASLRCHLADALRARRRTTSAPVSSRRA